MNRLEAVSFIKEMQSCADHEIRIEQISLNRLRVDNLSPEYIVTLKGPICDNCKQNAKLIARKHGYQLEEKSDKVIVYMSSHLVKTNGKHS